MFLNEVEQSYEIEVDFTHFAPSGYLTPMGYQCIANTVIGKHLEKYGVGFEKLIHQGISWVILSLTVDIEKPIVYGMKKVIGKTWYSKQKGIFYRREVSVSSEEGEVLFRCSTFSTLMDLNARSIYKSKNLPFELMPITEETLVEGSPTFKEKLEYTEIEKRKVRRSYIDKLGHMNNNRYGELCYDSLDDNEVSLERLKRIELYFVSELGFNEVFTLSKSFTDHRIVVQGYNEEKQKAAFYGIFNYR